jgi:CheY-like chemotaxis protein
MNARAVLIVDDNLDLAENLGEVLSQEGFRCAIVASGHAAIDRLDDTRFDLVITDLRMADGDGLTVVAAVRSRSPDTPIVLMTAFAGQLQLDMAERAGVSDVVAKPLDMAELIELVRRRIPADRAESPA